MVIITFKDLQLNGHGGNPAPLSYDLNLPPSYFPPPPLSLSAYLSFAPSSSLMNTELCIKYSRRRRRRARGRVAHFRTHSNAHNWLTSSVVCTLARINKSAFGRNHRRGKPAGGRRPSKFNAAACPATSAALATLHLFLLDSQPLKFNLGDVERIYFIGPFVGTCIFTLPKYLKHLHIPGTRRASM